MSMLLYGILLQTLYIVCGALRPCIPRDYGYGGVVCVCNATYCDNLDINPEHLLRPGYYLQYESKKGELPLQRHLVPLSGNNSVDSRITTVKYNVNPTNRYQEILGFGGAITDSVGINIASLSPRTQEELLRQYFAPEGISYSFVRIPIGGTDFSSHNYTYDDGQSDEKLSRFNLTNEDLVYKIPLVKKAMSLSPRPIKLLTTSWSAPFWMTEPRRDKPGFTRLKESYYQVLAEYFVKFLDAYKAHGLEFWALTPQNEPADGSLVYFGWNSLGWLPTEQRNFVAYHLGPTLHAKGYGNIKILIMDDQRILLPIWVQIMMGEEKLRRYVSGIAVHWYADWYRFAGPGLLSVTHLLFPHLFILYTEASIIHKPGEPAVKLGSWQNAEKYAQDIIQDFNNWATGWIDWNIALNDEGGPTWVNNTVDSPIIVNGSANEFYKQPMFYALAHFSKFVPPGSFRVDMTTTSTEGMEAVAFITPRNIIVIVLLNSTDSMKTLVRYLVYTLSAVAVISGEVEKQKCAARNYGENSVVCVCNSKYCDNIGTIAAPEPGSCLHFETNMAGLRLESQPCRISKGEGSGEPNISIAIINPSQTYQQILGFGGAITDSAGINIASLSSQAHSTLLSQYFGPQGIEYNFIRLPMGGSDFSIRYYTYDDVVNDARLSYFNLTYEDHRYKIPFVKQAIELSSRPVKLLTALWQVPIWMKEPRIGMHFPALGKLKENHYQLLADYMIRYLNSYKREGLEFWTLSPQNEPLSSFSFFWVPSTLTWTPKEQAEFLKNNLIPTLNSKGYGNLKLMLLDDVRPCINILLNEFKKHPEIMERAAALGVHWYMDDLFSPNVFSGIKRKFHNLPIISTEASILGGVRLGFWGNAERYVSDIIQDLNYEVAAWVDWNIALDTNGGPTYLSNYLDSPIIVNASADEFYKQPTFYAIAHFSKFVPPGSVRVNLKLDTHPQLQGIAFLTPEKTVTTVLTNRNSIPVKVELRVDEIGEVHIVLSPHSISTVVFGNYT